jgi:hypothetical protein
VTGADLAPVAFARLVAPAVDRAFRSAMARARPHAAELVARYCPDRSPGPLVEFRTALGWPGRAVTTTQAAAVLRYRDLAAFRAEVEAHPLLAVDVADAFRATDAGHEFLLGLLRVQGEVLGEAWRAQADRVNRLVHTLGRLLSAAAETGGEAFAAMAPPYEPPGVPDAAVLLNRLGTLRYHRADAHAAAWQAAGFTAAGIRAEPPGRRRDAVEAETDRRAAPPYAVLDEGERLGFLADLAALP